jgi:hypothetical protein
MEEILYFAMGSVVGAALLPRVRPVLLGIMTVGYKVADTVSAKTAGQRKNVEGRFAHWRQDWDAFVAEARDRARAKREATAKS